jgi:hypothetical protein
VQRPVGETSSSRAGFSASSWQAMIDGQVDQLMDALKIDRTRPDRWERAFLRLAAIHHGVGRLKFPKKKEAAPAGGRVDEQDAAFMEEFLLLRRDMSDRAAIRQLAVDPKYRNRFPYRPKRSYYQANAEPRRIEAFRKRHQKLRSQGTFLSALREIFDLNKP